MGFDDIKKKLAKLFDEETIEQGIVEVRDRFYNVKNFVNSELETLRKERKLTALLLALGKTKHLVEQSKHIKITVAFEDLSLDTQTGWVSKTDGIVTQRTVFASLQEAIGLLGKY